MVRYGVKIGKNMNRFFVDKENIKDSRITITGEDVAHISKVLRMHIGDMITVCDGECTDYECEITEIGKSEVWCNIKESFANPCEPDCRITVFQGLPKGDKMEWLIQKCVEIGVCAIVPTMTKRVIAKGDKGARWARVAMEAAKQCGRGALPQVEGVISFMEALSRASRFDLALIPYEEERENSLKSALQGKAPKTVAVFIGPEGGFDRSEIEVAKKCGIIPVTLGRRILRTETAGMSVASNILYEYEEVQRG